MHPIVNMAGCFKSKKVRLNLNTAKPCGSLCHHLSLTELIHATPPLSVHECTILLDWGGIGLLLAVKPR